MGSYFDGSAHFRQSGSFAGGEEDPGRMRIRPPEGFMDRQSASFADFLATHSPAGVLQSGLKANGSYYSSFVHNAFVPMWPYPGGFSAISGFGPQPTAAGYLLAKAMTALPEQQVRRVLEGSWATWLNWRTTDAQLAAALGIQMPSVPVIPSPVKPQPGAHMTVTGPPPQQSPVCTS